MHLNTMMAVPHYCFTGNKPATDTQTSFLDTMCLLATKIKRLPWLRRAISKGYQYSSMVRLMSNYRARSRQRARWHLQRVLASSSLWAEGRLYWHSDTARHVESGIGLTSSTWGMYGGRIAVWPTREDCAMPASYVRSSSFMVDGLRKA